MQDISRDEFNLLSGNGGSSVPGGDGGGGGVGVGSSGSDNLITGHTRLAKSPTIKLEDVDNYTSTTSWKSPHLCNLLRNSDDPLISGGTSNDNPIESSNSPILSLSPLIQSPIKASPTSTTTRAKKPNRTRRKGQVKLRFHHQALPQEYLDHYENTQKNILKQEKAKRTQQLEMEANETNNSVKNWLQKITDLNDEDISLSLIKTEPEIELLALPPQPPVPHQPQQRSYPKKVTATPPVPSSRVYNYSDLPYMGEMTLDNSKPRRGRKPKKQDICHLIYKNYGQIFPGTPPGTMKLKEGVVIPEEQHPVMPPIPIDDPKKTDIQNKIICSLLEKRLTQNLNSKRVAAAAAKLNAQAEPLNLCLRDTCKTLSTTGSSPTLTNSDYDDDDDLDIIEHQLDIANDPILAEEVAPIKKFSKSLNINAETVKPMEIDAVKAAQPEGLVYWPNANCFINPMALYYQKMMDGSEKPEVTIVGPKASTSRQGGIVVPKNISELIKKENLLPPPSVPTPSTTPSSVKSVDSTSSTSSSTNKSVIKLPLSTSSSTTSSAASATVTPTLQKRKRSAIFIPPMPLDSTSNPTTEVSICKFKFTGGAKPSLQEKKMLSVDSGGNFRYYSGTGDKSMRGYEFFPRESLQQSSLLAGGSSSGAFLNTPGEKIKPNLMNVNPTSADGGIRVPPHNPSLSVPSPSPLSLKISQPFSQSPMIIPQQSAAATSRDSPSDNKKRKSRRSIQREKLEKTFKEKGFLIQTQQLESAEGATYCKFRQLRRFTRYLFRSWKDYLPGDIQQQSAAGPAGVGTSATPAILNSPPSSAK